MSKFDRKTAEKNSAQTNRQTNQQTLRKCHLAVNQKWWKRWTNVTHAIIDSSAELPNAYST